MGCARQVPQLKLGHGPGEGTTGPSLRCHGRKWRPVGGAWPRPASLVSEATSVHTPPRRAGRSLRQPARRRCGKRAFRQESLGAGYPLFLLSVDVLDRWLWGLRSHGVGCNTGMFCNCLQHEMRMDLGRGLMQAIQARQVGIGPMWPRNGEAGNRLLDSGETSPWGSPSLLKTKRHTDLQQNFCPCLRSKAVSPSRRAKQLRIAGMILASSSGMHRASIISTSSRREH